MCESFFDAVKLDYQAAFSREASIIGIIYRFLLDPGFQAVFLYRLYSLLYRSGPVGKVIGKLIWRLSVSLNACYLMPGAVIGGGLYLPHPVGVVLGEGVVIGKNVTIYQGVTVGVKNRKSGDYPVIGNNVTCYVGSCVFGRFVVADFTTVKAYEVLVARVSEE